MATTESGEINERRSVQKLVYVLQQPEQTDSSNGIELERVLRVIVQRRWWIVGFIAVVTSIAILYALLATPRYRAEVVLMPRDGGGASALSAQLAQFGGLADLAGINLGSSGKQEPLGVLRSRGFVRRFIESNGLVGIIASQSNAGLVGSIFAGSQSDDIRTVVDLFVRSVMVVSEDKKSGFIDVSVTWTDPDMAASWANGLASQLNNEVRLRAMAESEKNIRYLRKQLETTDEISLQQSIARLLESEMKKFMLAKGTDEYAFRVIDVAEPPVKRTSPKRIMIITLAMLFGALISVGGALLVDPLRHALGDASGR